MENKNIVHEQDRRIIEAEALDKEIAQVEQGLEANFAKYASDKMNEEWSNLFFDNKEQFFKNILQLLNTFLEEGYNKLRKKRVALQADIEQGSLEREISKARDSFLAKHPDVDIDALMRQYNEELGSKYKAELEKLPPDQFLEAVYRFFSLRDKIAKDTEGGERLKEEGKVPLMPNSQHTGSSQEGDYEYSPMSRL